MTISHRIESVPQTWDDDRDNAFFRIVAALFSPDFAYGAGVLLAENDSDDEETTYVASPADDDFAFAVAVRA